MKTATITFHGAYNYGSVLQTYALQEFVTSLGKSRGAEIDYSVINFRTQVQKQLYWQTKRPFTKGNAVKWLMRLPYRKKLSKQAAGFEEFLSRWVHLTDEVDEKTIGRFATGFNCYISGSDQIFNIRSRDFSPVYLLNFTDSPNKISYAASLGPLQIDWSKYHEQSYRESLAQFQHLSLREQRSKDMVDALLESENSEIHVDPTLLLPVEQWRKVQSDRNYKNGQYILIYCLEPTKRHMEIARKLSKAIGLPVVSTGYRCKHDYFNPFVKLYDAGPGDFLSLVDHAALVLTSSFHGTAFSVIYDKPFWVIDGMEDNRIRSLLQMTGLEANSISDILPDFHKLSPKTANEVEALQKIENEKARSKEYLMKALGL